MGELEKRVRPRDRLRKQRTALTSKGASPKTLVPSFEKIKVLGSSASLRCQPSWKMTRSGSGRMARGVGTPRRAGTRSAARHERTAQPRSALAALRSARMVFLLGRSAFGNICRVANDAAGQGFARQRGRTLVER
jgi:hypothetical protein